MDNLIILAVFGLVGLVLFVNILKVFMNLFGGSTTSTSLVEEEEENPLRDEVRSKINEKVKPHLNSLEGMYAKSESEEKSFSSYVLSKVKDTLAPFIEKDEKLVEEEVCKCCGDYESAECKENFCLEGSGISCNKS